MVPRTKGVETKYIYGLMGVRGGGAGRLILDEVRVPERYALNGENNGFEVFMTNMVPERLGTAAMTIGSVRPALEIATRYTSRRKAFGKKIMNFQGVGFKVADCSLKMDAMRAMAYATALSIDSGKVDAGRVRRMVSQTKKFITEGAWEVVNNCMQVMGGIGYTNVFPIERILRDIRLSMIWVGTNEIMQYIIQTEWYKEFLNNKDDVRDVELDSVSAFEPDEKIYE
jgi:alkylation response protein AidB-like acyl-CoA dehydrogenase